MHKTDRYPLNPPLMWLFCRSTSVFPIFLSEEKLEWVIIGPKGKWKTSYDKEEMGLNV